MSEKTEAIARQIREGKLVSDQPLPAPPPAAVDPENPFGKPEHCKLCPLFKEPGPVWGEGPEDAKITLVGEAPGADEVDAPQHRSKYFRPFIGGAGKLLSALLYNANVERSSCFVTNVVKCRPPHNRTPLPEEMRACLPFLLAELRLIKPNVSIALGETALHALTGKKGITLHRGVPTDGPEGRKVFPSWHPAFIARQRFNWPFAVHDLVRAAKESEYPEIRRLPINIIRDASVAVHGRSVLDAARARRAATFDFETTGLSPMHDSIVLLGLATRSDQAHVFNWTPPTAELFQTLLDEPDIEIVGQNILYFDLPFAEEKGIRVRWTNVFDTLVAFHLANSTYGQTTIYEQDVGTARARGMDKDLSMIASCHTDMEHWKSSEGYAHDLRGVCGKDCIATDRSAMTLETGLKAELERYGMLKLYYDHVLPVHPIIHSMSKLGVRIHEERAARWSVKLEKEADSLEAALREALNDRYLNLNSPKQLMHIFYDVMHLPVQYKEDPRTKELKPTANAEAIEKLADMAPENQLLGTIVAVRALRKMKSTYVDDALSEGRVHPHFGVSKTATGRFNSWNPNAQNVPEVIREIWIPDNDDCLLLVGDYSQIEWRIAMVLSADPVGLGLLSSGVDNHRAIAAEVLDKPLEQVTADERHAAKFIVYGLGYGRGAESLSKGVRTSFWQNVPRAALDRAFVQRFIPRFFARFRAYRDWRETNVQFVREHNYLANPYGRRRWWYDRGAPTEQYNFPMQSTAADIMYDALIDLNRELPKAATLRLTVHDEVVINTPKDCAREAFICTRDVMQKVQTAVIDASADPAIVKQFYPNGWFVPVDLHLGTSWKMAKSKDPNDIAARQQIEASFGLGGAK